MAHLWFRDKNDEHWSAITMGARALNICVCPPHAPPMAFRLGENADALVVRAVAGGAPVWVLLAMANSEVRVNGFAPVAGMRVLQDRDEIRTGVGGTLFFSMEALASVEEFVGGEQAIYCGRCRQRLEQGHLAVRCPRCGIWYHQADLPCWTYSPTCAFCPQSTPLDTGYSWVPEE